MNKISFFTFLLIGSVLFSASANDSTKTCADHFADKTHDIVQFPVPPGEFQVREFGNGYFGLVLGSSPLPAGSIFEVRAKKDIRLPERGSRALLLKQLEVEQPNNIQTGRWIVVKNPHYHPFLKEVYTSRAELDYILYTISFGEPNMQFNKTDLSVLSVTLRLTFGIYREIATEIAEKYGQLSNSTNLFTVRQFPRIIMEVLKKYGMSLVVLDENGHPI